MRILIQFIGQAIGLLLLIKARDKKDFPYKMPLFPVPVFIPMALWLFILYSSGIKMTGYGLVVIVLGIIVFFVKAKVNKEWPFVNTLRNNPVIEQA